MGNAQNHYILYHPKARKFIEDNISDVKMFDKWTRKIKLEKFEHYKGVWKNEKNELFKRVYRHLSWEFLTEEAIPYILSSRIKRWETKNSHLRHLYRFLEGIRDPDSFTYFKKS